MLSSSSSLHSGSYSAGPELPLIACKKCKREVRELVSKQSETMWRKFYRCNNDNADGTRCDFFRWQASYVVLLIREGFVTNSDQVTDFVMIALNDHSKALESLTTSIRDTKRKLDNLEEFMKQELVVMKQELDKLKAAMVENEENKKSMASALELMKGDLQKLEGSTTVKPRTLGMCSLGLLLLAILIGWFLMRLKNGGGGIQATCAEPLGASSC